MIIKNIILIISFIILTPSVAFAAMSSTNYKINADVIGTGGDDGSSANYGLTDTLGQPVIGIGSSTNYKAKQGFWYMIATAISLVVDSNTVNLGTLTPGTPVTGDSTLTVTTDAWGGYELYVSQNGQLTHTDTVTTIPDYSCAIASPCSWSGVGLGFSISSGTNVDAKWGTSPNLNYAAFPLTQTKFHETIDYKSGGDNTVIEYKVDAPTSQKSGQYSNIITYTAAEKL